MLESKTAPQALPELRSPEFKLLIGLTITAIIEAVSYAWIEVLLYTSSSPILYNNWIFGHYNSYHVVLAFLVLSMIFGVGFVAWLTYSPTRFRKFFLLTLGDFLLWVLLEDEFTFIFSGASHTPTDWTNWPIGAAHIFGNYIPVWYVLAAISIFLLWFYGLYAEESRFSPAGNQLNLARID
ncbi:MAG: hypothetical protein ACHQ1H_10380 [Nitrososphaerales archaeon]